MAIDSYSRMVAWLKIVLPLAALALLSTLFLLSRAIDPTSSIPFADTEVQERMRDQQVTEPFYSGTTADGDQIAFMARRLTTLPNQPGSNRAEDISARINLVSGVEITMQSAVASIDISADLTRLSGEVILTTSNGYQVRSQELIARMSRLNVQSPGQISALSPMGDLTAGQMQLTASAPGAPAHLIFTNGVKLLYQPKEVKD